MGNEISSSSSIKQFTYFNTGNVDTSIFTNGGSTVVRSNSSNRTRTDLTFTTSQDNICSLSIECDAGRNNKCFIEIRCVTEEGIREKRQEIKLPT